MSAVLTLVEDRVSVRVDSLSIDQNAGKHDLSTITLKSLPNARLLSGTPVRLQQNFGTETFDFYGYIDTALPYHNGVGRNGGVYYLLSASTALRSGRVQTWDNRTAFEIASDIVSRHGLGLEMDKVEGHIGHFSQATESDWEALVKLTAEIGFVIVADNSIVRILDPSLSIRRAEQQPLFPLPLTPSTKFIMEESLIPVGYEGYEFTGVDKFLVPFKVTVNEDSPVSRLIREEVDSLGDALAAAARIRRRVASQNRATLVTDYHPSIRAGSAVLVQEPERDRHWFVLSATHAYESTQERKARTTLSLVRHSNRFTTGAQPRFLKRPGTILSVGRWRSSNSWLMEL